MDKIFVPPIKIQGIKTKLVPLIKENAILKETTVWIEPFMGSGVVGFNIRPNRAMFSDINPHLINFYNALKFKQISNETVREFLSEEGNNLSCKGEQHYYEIRERFNEFHNPLDFLFLNRACFNGMIRFNRKGKFNVPYCHKPRRFSKAYITKIVNQIKYVEQCFENYDWSFICQDFRKTILQINKEKDIFIYCDPPYIGRHTDYYDSWDEVSEKNLCYALKQLSKPFIISTWVQNKFRINNYVKDIWGFCNGLTQEHFYHVGAKEMNRHQITEAILMNFSLK